VTHIKTWLSRDGNSSDTGWGAQTGSFCQIRKLSIVYVECGTDVEQQVGIIAGGPNQVLNQIGQAFRFHVAQVEAPRSPTVHGLGNFERKLADGGAAPSGGVLAGQVLFERLHVFTRVWLLVVVGDDKGAGLKSVYERVSGGELPVGVGLVPHAIEPYPAELAIIGERFAQLRIHEIQVPGPLTVARTALPLAGATQWVVVGMMPVELRVVNEELDVLAMALIGELPDNIFAVWRRIRHVVLLCFVANMEKPS